MTIDERDPELRIARLLDNGKYELLIPRTACGMAAATGEIKGNRVVVFASDATLQGGALGADAARETAFTEAFKPLLDTYVRETPVMILRDYHAENLLWLPARQGPARAGQLDFQDAMLGHPAYDLVSLLQDARRDVSSDVAEAMVRHYCHQTNSNHSDFTTAYHLLGAQRNLRILGVFARLSLMAGKPHYIDLIPRVWAHLMHDLAHPALAPVAALIRADLPEPTPALLQRLKDLCGTVPAP